MKRIALMLLLTLFTIGSSANSSYGIALRRWYNASEYFKEGMLNFYLDEDKIYFRIGTDEWTTTFTVDGVKRDDFVYMMLEKDNTFRERKEFINDYLVWMGKNLPDGAYSLWKDGGRESHYRRREKLIPEWDNEYRKYMIERGWYRNEAPKPVVQSNQGAVQELDPLAEYVPVVEVLTKKPDQNTKPVQEKNTAKTSPTNNAKTTGSKTSSSTKSSAMSSSSGSTSSSTSNKSSASSKENSGEEDGNSVAAWAIIIGGLYYMFGRDKKKGSKTAEQRKKEEEKRRKEKRQREAAARRREEERDRQEKERKFMEECYYEEWLKKNQSSWGS